MHIAVIGMGNMGSLYGYIARESRKLNLPCPYNEALTALVKIRQYLPQEQGEHDPN